MGIKVLHLIDSGGLYGAEKMLLSLVQEQLKQGLEPMILSAGEPGVVDKPIEVEAERLGLPVMAWRMKPGLNIAESSKILHWALSSGYDILHSHGFKFNVLLGGRPLVIRRIPMIATLHGYVHAKKFSKMWLYEMLDRVAITFVQRVVLVGEAMKKELPPKFAQNKKVRVIPNGLDVETINAEANRPLGQDILDFVARHSPIVLGVGRLSQEKGFDRLIDAFPIVCKEFDNPGLILVGEGKQKGALVQRKGELGLQSRVLMPGYCSNVPGIQKIADLLVVPSHTEGLPITLLESMAMGLPVLASPVGEMPSVLGKGEGGYLLPPDCDHDQLGSCIVNCLHDTARQSKVSWSSKKVSESYSVQAMELSYRELYQSMLGVQA
ncbi:glycosyltransferase [Marinobacter panjinensis]|uniref:Glycosyltransferase n=1 Tax=Marinobacter panjinensis TaxID=2576384 RepID=A0A4U6R0N5_9GAMM|nr:glycosyltransferase [Marinobacter panjinensis]MCR8915809.1 glycosyltransferase [Marinobacter panjinensis]TKV67214.1 glycosyltransferase [Marinobacter panjinensis]